MTNHAQFMHRAIELARKAEGHTSPNPMVGAVLVRNDEIIGEGFHQAAGMPHAEIEALQSAGNAEDSVLYVTMEPSSHFGKTPPSTDILIEAGVREVYYAVPDPNRQVAGKGHQQLALAGIKVHRGLLEDEVRELNRDYLHFISTGRPYVVAKYHMSLDGKIATATGESRWITGLSSRLAVHRLRNLVDAVLVGVGAVVSDNPQLTTRLPDQPCRHPLRIVLDSRGRAPLDARVFDPHLPGQTLVAGTPELRDAHRARLEARGVEVLILPADSEGMVPLDSLLRILAKRGVVNLMVEGGSRTLGSFLTAQMIQEAWAFIGGKIIGGSEAPSPFGGQGIDKIDHALQTDVIAVERFGEDMLIKARIKRG